LGPVTFMHGGGVRSSARERTSKPLQKPLQIGPSAPEILLIFQWKRRALGSPLDRTNYSSFSFSFSNILETQSIRPALEYKRALRMAFRMPGLKRSKSGAYTARKGIPVDVRAEYQRLYGRSWEELFRLPAGTPQHVATQSVLGPHCWRSIGPRPAHVAPVPCKALESGH